MNEQQINEKWEEFKRILLSTNRKGINEVIDWLDKSDFKYAPASTQYHGSYKGGLLEHSLNVYYHMYDFPNLIQFFELTDDTIAIIALLHDVCKINVYESYSRNVKDEEGKWIQVLAYKYNDKMPFGHGEKSVMLLMKNGLELSYPEIFAIRSHMGAFKDNEILSEVSQRFSVCPQSLVLHFADMIATYTTESPDLQSRYKNKINRQSGRNIVEWLQLLNTDKYININGIEYKLAPLDSEVNDKIISIKDEQNNIVKVYSPHGDGLPF